MTPSFAIKRGVRYRYYVSRATTEGRQSEAGTIPRVPAPDVERTVLDALSDLFPNEGADGKLGTVDCSSRGAGSANRDGDEPRLEWRPSTQPCSKNLSPVYKFAGPFPPRLALRSGCNAKFR
jgi:hypothetical protein